MNCTDIIFCIIFKGQPNGSCYVTTPYRYKNDALDYNYYSQTWNYTGMPLLSKYVNILTTEALQQAGYIDPLHKHLLDIGTLQYYVPEMPTNKLQRGYSRISILTLDFANGSHTDCGDYHDVTTNTCSNIIEKYASCGLNSESNKKKARLQYARTMINTVGIGVPTTCGHCIYIDEKSKFAEDDVMAYFCCNDLGISMQLQSNMYHHFHAYGFSHQTSVPIVVKDKKVYYANTGVHTLAWGNGGAAGRQRRQVGIQLGIIRNDERLTQTRIINWLTQQTRNHPNRQLFEQHVGRQDA